LKLVGHHASRLYAYHDGDNKVYRDGHSNENVKTNGVLLRNRQIHVHTCSENRFVAVILIRRHCRTPKAGWSRHRGRRSFSPFPIT